MLIARKPIQLTCSALQLLASSWVAAIVAASLLFTPLFYKLVYLAGIEEKRGPELWMLIAGTLLILFSLATGGLAIHSELKVQEKRNNAVVFLGVTSLVLESIIIIVGTILWLY